MKPIVLAVAVTWTMVLPCLALSESTMESRKPLQR